MRRGLILPLIFSVITITFSLWLILTSYSFLQCIAAGGISNWLENIWIYRTCVGEYFRVQGQEVVILFTVVLAISTIFLWVSTRDAANQAKLAAQHTQTVERAYV